MTGREDIKQCIRLWPHKIKGEGHFLALLKKADGEQPTFKYEKIKKVKLTPEDKKNFSKTVRMDIDWSHVREHQGKLFYLKEDIPEMKDNLVAETVKAACMVFSMIPVMIVYPWLQKYFVKGVMIGSVKG